MPSMIKLITSVRISTNLRHEFQAGLAEAGHLGYGVDYEEINGNYDNTENATKHDLYKAFDRANNDQNASGNAQTYDLVVAAGGLVSAHAAVKKLDAKPFLVIVGQLPKFSLQENAQFFGGVNLNMSHQNVVRHDLICGHYGVNKNNVCLIWNDHSKMGSFEQKEWNSRGWPDQPVTKQTDADIISVVDAVATANQAAVISGDPFFTDHRDTIIKEANSKNVVTCYPFNTYAYNATPPLATKSVIYGPDLKLAYRLVGRKAGALLDNVSDTGLDPCPTVGPIFIGG